MITIQHHRDDASPLRRRRTGTGGRLPAVASAATALFLLAFLLTVVGWLAPGAAGVARADNTSGDQKVAVFEDVVVGPDEIWDNVVVVGGDAVIRGTVENVVVVVGGDLVVADGAEVGARLNRDDAAVVSVFGDVTVEPGATVRGRTVDVGGGVPGVDTSAAADPVFRPWRTGSILNWIWSTVFLAVVAVIATAIAPRQVAAVRERVRHHFFSSFGWGALGAIIAVPIITVALIITIIGIILVVPWLAIVLPVMSLFGLVAVGAMVGRLILGAKEDKRETVMLAAVLGVIIINISRWIPVAWIIIIGLLWLVGFGAIYVAIYVWLRDRRRRRREAAAREQAAWAAATGPGGISSSVGPPVVPVGPATGPPQAAPTGSWPAAGPEATAAAPPGPAVPQEGAPADMPPAPGSDVASEPPAGGRPDSGGPPPG